MLEQQKVTPADTFNLYNELYVVGYLHALHLLFILCRCVCRARVPCDSWGYVHPGGVQEKEEYTRSGVNLLSQHTVHSRRVSVTETEGWCPSHHWFHSNCVAKGKICFNWL